MHSKSFQLADNQTFLPANITGGKLFVSPDQANGTGVDLSTSIRVVIDYHDLQSSPPGAMLQAVVEGKSDSGQYYVLAYQFTEFQQVGIQQRRQIVMDPSIVWPHVGTENIVYIGGSTVEQISNQQGVMPPTWRVIIAIRDPDGSFVSARLSVYGERFNHQALPTNFSGVLTDEAGRLVTVESN